MTKPTIINQAKKTAKQAKTAGYKAVKSASENVSAAAGAGYKGVKAAKSGVSNAAKAAGSTTAGKTVADIGKYFSHGMVNAAKSAAPPIGGVLEKALFWKDSSGLERHSPIEQEKKLKEYGKSFNLDRFDPLIEEVEKSLYESASKLPMQRQDDVMDVTQDESIRKSFEAAKTNNLTHYETQLKVVNDTIGKSISKTKLTSIQQQAKKIREGIAKGKNPNDPKLASNDIQILHTPQEIVNAFKELRNKAENELKEDRKADLAKVEQLFEPTTSNDPSPFKLNLAALLGEKSTDKVIVDALVAKHKAQFIKQIEDHYDKAEGALKDSFEDKTNQKDADGKDLADKHGILTRSETVKQAIETDLLKRVEAYERKKSQGAVLPSSTLTAQVGHGPQTVVTDPSCLKDRSMKEIENLEISGRIYGKRPDQAKPTTTSGSTLIAGDKGQVTLKVSGLFFPYHVINPDRLREDLEDMVEKGLAETGKLEVEWEIIASTDELRNKLILEAYKASVAKGIDPKNITMTVKGGTDKQTFHKENIEKILTNSQPPIPHGAEVIQTIQSTRKKQREDIARERELEYRKSTTDYKNQLEKNIVRRGINKEDEINLTSPSEQAHKTPGMGKT